jgi:hypothetical protein
MWIFPEISITGWWYTEDSTRHAGGAIMASVSAAFWTITSLFFFLLGHDGGHIGQFHGKRATMENHENLRKLIKMWLKSHQLSKSWTD